MKRTVVLVVVFLLVAVAAWASEPKNYKMTGTVVEVTDSVIVIQQGKVKRELARNKATGINAAMKAGDKVTVEYAMVAVQVEKAAERQTKPKAKSN